MISLESVLALFAQHAYLVIFLASLIDATGTPFPGRLLLMTAGGLAATGRLSALLLIALAVAGVVAGDHLWYVAGRLAGGRVTRLYCRIVMLGAPGCIERARAYLARFGPAAVIIGRFVAGVRIVVTPLAAESGMPYLRYAAFDLLGASLWCSLWVMVGFALGAHGVMGHTATQMAVSLLASSLLITIGLITAVRLIGTARAQSSRR